MFPLETSRAGLTRMDFEMINYLERPRRLKDLRKRFPGVNVAKRIMDLQDKGLVLEKDLKYVSKFYTDNVKRIIDGSKVPKEIKRDFHSFLHRVDDPFVRGKVYDKECGDKVEKIMSLMSRSISRKLTGREVVFLRLLVIDLVEKLKRSID